jgi:hypothetical protein
MDRKATPWRPVRLRWECLRDFSDSLSETVWKIALGVWITWLLVRQSGNKGASRLILASWETPE